MPNGITEWIDFLNSPSFNLGQTVALVYFGLLWLSIIIWVTRDSINRSNSLAFQIFAILINIIIPIVGVILYLIIRPGRTTLERYYEEVERNLLEDSNDEKISCTKCMTILDKNFVYCPNCAEKLQKICPKCQKNFPTLWNICPFCGVTYSEKATSKKMVSGKK